MPLRKDIKYRISCDMRGKITTGMKSDKGFPMSIDYFDISMFPELIAAYGNKPSKLVVIFPSNNIEDFIFTEYSQWGGKGKTAVKKRNCDGETCTFNAAGKVSGKAIEAGTTCPCVCKEFNLTGDDACKCYTHMKAFVVNPSTGKIENHITYKFENHSVNSSDNVLTEIMKIANIAGGRLMGIPFLLSVDMKETLKGGEKRKFPIWSIQAVGSIEKVLAFAENGFLPVHESNALSLAPGAIESPKALASGIEKTPAIHQDAKTQSPATSGKEEAKKVVPATPQDAQDGKDGHISHFPADWETVRAKVDKKIESAWKEIKMATLGELATGRNENHRTFAVYELHYRIVKYGELYKAAGYEDDFNGTTGGDISLIPVQELATIAKQLKAGWDKRDEKK